MEKKNKPDRDKELNRLYILLAVALFSIAAIGLILFLTCGGLSLIGGE
jgi:nitrate reductase NapE component